jgi:K+-sensing histidine kinase KdpD
MEKTKMPPCVEFSHSVEITRRNLMAYIAHELRTPLTVLVCNLRAILDGVQALNEDEIALLHEQTHH